MNKTFTYRVNNLVGFKNRPESDYVEDSTFVKAKDEEEAKKLAMEKFNKIYKNVLHWRNYVILIGDVINEGEV